MSSRLFRLAVALLALGAFAATSAGAASKHRKHKRATQAYAARTVANVHRGTDKFPAGPLYFNGGEYLGDDPDPFIRSQLWRDLGAHFGGDP